MKSIRRSLNKDKERQSTSSNNGPASPPLPGSFRSGPSAPLAPNQGKTVAPPKAVIRATHSYRSRSALQLSFEKGDFFHVLGERYASEGGSPDGEDWFEAHNPLTNARGLVPMNHFEVLGKQGRPGGGPARSPSTSANNSPTMQSASQFGGGPSQQQQQSISQGMPALPQKAQAGKGQSLYGIVQFDFEAQRQDELDAKKGEPIVVIAQSNHEWFVAKPIGRLGGPGLIPVSYVSIMNMATGKALDQKVVQEMIQGGALPPVEEWKKSTAEYKQNSIPLGKFDFSSAGPSAQAQQASRQPANQGGRQVNSHYESSNNNMGYEPHHQSYSSPALNQSNNSSSSLPQHMRYSSDRYGQQQDNEDQDPLQTYGLVVQASVESFHQEEGSFWSHVRCSFSSRCSLVLYRLYDDFYDFQIALMDVFRVEAGRELPPDARPGDKPTRTLPKMPGPVAPELVDEVVCAQRVADLTVYLGDLCRLPEHVRSHSLFFDFLVPRPGDVEVPPPQAPEDESFDVGRTAAENDIVELLDRMPGANGTPTPEQDLSRQMEQSRISGYDSRPQSRGNSAYGGQPYDRPESSASNLSGPSRMSSQRGNTYDRAGPPASSMPSQRPPSSQSYSQQSMHQKSASQQIPPKAQAVPPPFIKIKIFHRNTDDLIAIRVPPNVTRDALLDKVRERLGGDVTKLRYKDDQDQSGQARLVELFNDDDLDYWLRTATKMSLFAD